MWSVWSERVQVYLGAGLVLVQRSGLPLWVFEPPATLPLADVLRQVDQELKRSEDKPWRLHMHLSAALCRPLAFMVPAGVSRYPEVLALAQASAARVWDMSAEQADGILCSLDVQHHGMAAAMLTGTHQVIARWAKEYQGQLVSLQPLWAAATAARVCRGNNTNSMLVLEPDALTVLDLKQPSAVQVMCFPGKHDAAEARSCLTEVNAQVKGAKQLKGVALSFNREPTQAVRPDGPAVWAQHWSLLP